MMNPNPNEEPERTIPFPGPNAPKSRVKYRPTPEEMRILKECNTESFFQRGLPFSALSGAATYYAIKTGLLNPSKKLGATPKVTAAVIIGFFLGKFSYHQKCAEKFMALPDSKIGHVLRARKSGFQDDTDPLSVPSISLTPFSGITDSYSDITPPSGSIDYENRPLNEGLDDSFRPSVDNPIILQEEEMPPEQKHVTSYDELRKKNREEYEQKRLAVYRQTKVPIISSKQPPPSSGEFAGNEEHKAPTANQNRYGDVWG